jgi:hypothetical protein
MSEGMAPPGEDEVAALKRLAAGIIRGQGNRFIKELLRCRGIRIGTNKDDFERNLNEAIDRGELRVEHLEGWLQQVEGWGNQHIYLYPNCTAAQDKIVASRLPGRRHPHAAILDSRISGETERAALERTHHRQAAPGPSWGGHPRPQARGGRRASPSTGLTHLRPGARGGPGGGPEGLRGRGARVRGSETWYTCPPVTTLWPT